MFEYSNPLMGILGFFAGEDQFDASFLGEAAEVVQEFVCDDELIFIKG